VEGRNGGSKVECEMVGTRHERRRLLFWNVAGTLNKDIDFWDYVKRYDYVGLCETWVTENMWENLGDRLPSSHVWSCSFATRRKEKGRAMGGLIIGIKKEWADRDLEFIKREEGNIGMVGVKDTARTTNVVLVYNREKNDKELGEILYKITEEYKEDRLIIGGDMNIRIGELGSDEEEGGLTRKSKDKIINNKGKILVELLQESGLNVLNGRSVGDGEGEFTYVCRCKREHGDRLCFCERDNHR